MTRYAAQTAVNADRTRTEIERTLKRYGATSFAYGWETSGALIGFKSHGRMIRMRIQFKELAYFLKTPHGRRRSKVAALKVADQDTRALWRALLLIIKAKLEAVESGVSTFEEEFMAFIMLPDGITVGEFMSPQIDAAYKTGRMPPLLGAPKDTND